MAMRWVSRCVAVLLTMGMLPGQGCPGGTSDPDAPPSTVAAPTFEPDGGVFTDQVEVIISCATPGATTRYTTDGSTPSRTNGTTISSGSSVTLWDTTTLKAMAYKDGMTDSPIKTAAYSRTADPGPIGETLTIMLPGGVPLEMVKIPAGTFQMGDISGVGYSNERPVHTVTIGKAFYMGKYEVTQEQWQAVMGTNPSYFSGSNLPVERVSWNDCQAFCQAVRSQTGHAVRLPTEAEWEYACRAGSTADYYFGNDASRLEYHAWYEYWYPYNVHGQTQDVGGKLPNAFGLHDMHGNVWEWCADWYDSDYYGVSPQNDPQGPPNGMYRVLRGGSWNDSVDGCRVAYRYYLKPDYRDDTLGFRCVLGTE